MFHFIVLVLGNIIITIVSSTCPRGFFKVSHMVICHPWLTCDDLPQITVLKQIGQGVVKTVHRAMWRGNVEVAVSFLNSKNLAADFHHNLEMLKLYSDSPLVVQLVGFCSRENILVTEYHMLGSAANLASVLPEGRRDERSALSLCLNYASLINLIHSEPNGPRVMCDSSDLSKLLSQLLIKDDRTLILNDLDALPLVAPGKRIKCGHLQLSGDFIAPEQRWPFPEQFDDVRMPGYGFETDIWKLATVCETFLRYVPNSDAYLYSLYPLHRRCKSPTASLRPSARDLVEAYSKLLSDSRDEL